MRVYIHVHVHISAVAFPVPWLIKLINYHANYNSTVSELVTQWLNGMQTKQSENFSMTSQLFIYMVLWTRLFQNALLCLL